MQEGETMETTIKKLFFAWQMDKEKAWLEQKAKEGLILKAVRFGRYIFTQSEPVDLVYEFDFQILNKKNEPDYLDLFEDWTFVDRFGGWYYFSKPRVGNNNDSIYSDLSSKRSMFKRLIGFLALVGFPLFYQLVIFYPNMDPEEYAFPRFYFFFRIVVLLFTGLYLFVMIKILFALQLLKKDIRE